MNILNKLTGDVSQMDAMFAAMMHHHHEQGLEMARLTQERAATDGVRAAAAAMATDQAGELEELEQILNSFGAKPMPDPGPVESIQSHHMNKLQQAGGTAVDELFLQMMSMHHIDAIHQAELYLPSAQDERLRALTEKSRESQLEDLQQMQGLLEGLGR